jgi:hypothetical protein
MTVSAFSLPSCCCSRVLITLQLGVCVPAWSISSSSRKLGLLTSFVQSSIRASLADLDFSGIALHSTYVLLPLRLTKKSGFVPFRHRRVRGDFVSEQTVKGVDPKLPPSSEVLVGARLAEALPQITVIVRVLAVPVF